VAALEDCPKYLDVFVARAVCNLRPGHTYELLRLPF
jgi:hypothetical protein